MTTPHPNAARADSPRADMHTSDVTQPDAPRADTKPANRPLAGIDGLRALAALAVLGSHVAAHTHAERFGPLNTILALGGHGLTLFFVLSGFLLYRPFVKTITRQRPWPSIGTYSANRLLRIFPGYLTILILAAVVLPLGYTRAFDPRADAAVADTVGRVTDPLTLLADVLLVQTFFPHTLKTGIGPAWSLTVELCFYAALPLVSWIGYRVARRHTTSATSPTTAAERTDSTGGAAPTEAAPLPEGAGGAATNRREGLIAALIPAAILLTIGLAGKTAYHLMTTGDPTNRYLETFGPTWAAVLHTNILTRADLFAVGMVVAVIEHAHRTRATLTSAAARAAQQTQTAPTHPAPAVAAPPPALDGSPITPALTSGRPAWVMPATTVIFGLGAFLAGAVTDIDTGCALGCAAILTLIVIGRDPLSTLLTRALDLRPLRYTGTISYSIYLWHVPTIWAVHHMLGTPGTAAAFIGYAAAVLALTYVLSMFTYHAVEAPTLALKPNKPRPASPTRSTPDSVDQPADRRKKATHAP